MVGLSNFVDKHLSEQQTRDLLTKIKEKNLLGPNQAETTILLLANLYMRLEEDRVGLNYVMQAAHLLYQTGQKKKAVEYYDYVIGHFSLKE
jgi:hypothetical protein